MSSQASSNFHRSEQFTNLNLVGGRDCVPGKLLSQQNPDLWVKGGAIVEKTLCVVGNITTDDFLIGNICSEYALLDTVREKYVNEGIEIIGEIRARDLEMQCGNVGNVGLLSVQSILPATACGATSIQLVSNTDVFGDLQVGANVSVGGDTVMDGELCVFGDATFKADANVDGKLTTEELCVLGNATFLGNVFGITVSGNTGNIMGKLTADDLCVTNDATIGGDLDVGGKLTTEDLCVNNDGMITGNLTVGVNNGLKLTTHDLCVNNNIDVTNDGTIGGNLDVGAKLTAGELCVNTNADITGDGTIGGNLDVGGKLTTEELCVNGDATFLGNVFGINVTGNIGNVAGDFTVGGKLTAGELCVDTNGTITGNLDVGAKLTTDDLCVNNNADITGDGTIGGNLDVGGKLTTEELCVNGDATFLGNVFGINVTGNIGNVAGDFTVGGKLTAGELCVDTNGTITGNLDVGDKLTTNDLCVNNDSTTMGDATIGGNLDVGSKLTTDDLCVNNNADITGDGTIGGNLDVGGKLTTEDLCVNNDSTTMGDATISGNLDVGGKLTTEELCVNTAGTVTGNLDVGGKLTAEDICVNDDLTVTDKTTTQELCVLGDAQFFGNVSITGNLGSGVDSWSAGTTGFTPSSPTMGSVVMDGTLVIGHGGTNSSAALVNGFMMISSGGAIVEGPSYTDPTFTTVTTTGNVDVGGKLTTEELCVTDMAIVGTKLTTEGLCVGPGGVDVMSSVRIAGDLDMDCGIVSNIATLYVGNIFGKSPVDVHDNFNMVDTVAGGKITFESGVILGNLSSSLGHPGSVVIGKGATAPSGTHDNIAIGYVAYANNRFGIAIGNEARSDTLGFYGVAIGKNAHVNGARTVVIGEGGYARGGFGVCLGFNSRLNQPGGTTNASSIAIGNQAETSNFQQIAMGYDATIDRYGYEAVAIGRDSLISGSSCRRSIAIGPRATVTAAYNSVVMGYYARTSGTASVSIGHSANIAGFRSVGIGQLVTSGSERTVSLGYGTSVGNSCDASVAIGSGASCTQGSSSGANSVAIGSSASTSHNGANAIGWSCTASGERAISIGNFCTAGGYRTISIGTSTFSPSQDAIGIGFQASGSQDCVCIGRRAQSTTTGAICIGQYANVIGNSTNGICIGKNTDVQAGCEESISIGYNAKCEAGAPQCIAIGNRAFITSPFNYDNTQSSIAIGDEATVQQDGSYSIAIGHQAEVNTSVTGAVAIGNIAVASVDDCVALGPGATVNDTSHAFGLGVHTSSVNPAMLGMTVNGDDKQMELYTDVYAATTTSGGTLVLSATSAHYQFLSGASNHTVRLPDAGTVVVGFWFKVVNRSTGTITVQSADTSTLIVIPPGEQSDITCILASGTTPASWFASAVTGISTAIPALITPNNYHAELKGVPVGGLYRSFFEEYTTLTFAITSSIPMSSTTLTVTVTAGVITPGMFLSGGSVDSGTQIVSQLTGTAGSTGTYMVDTAQSGAATPTAVLYSTASPDLVYVRTV